MSQTVTPKPLGQVQLGTGFTQVYSPPAATTGVCRLITICNTDTAPRTFSLYKVPNGGSPVDANALLRNIVINANQTITDDGAHVLATGDALVGIADVASKISVTAEGAEVT